MSPDTAGNGALKVTRCVRERHGPDAGTSCCGGAAILGRSSGGTKAEKLAEPGRFVGMH